MSFGMYLTDTEFKYKASDNIDMLWGFDWKAIQVNVTYNIWLYFEHHMSMPEAWLCVLHNKNILNV